MAFNNLVAFLCVFRWDIWFILDEHQVSEKFINFTLKSNGMKR